MKPRSAEQEHEREPASSGPARVRHRRRLWLAVIAVLVVGAVLPLVGVAWGLPYVLHPDEPLDLTRVHAMLVQRTLEPPRFGYPSLFFYVQLLVHAGHVGIGELLGWYRSASAVHMPRQQALGDGVTPDSSVFVVARSTTVVLNVALVGATMWLAWLLSRRRTAAVLAGLLVAVHPIMVHNARLATPDTLAALTATVAVAAAVAVARNPSMRTYLLAGAAAGLATGSKYNVVVVFIALVVAYAIGSDRRGPDLSKLALAAVVAAAVFVLTTPFSVLDVHKFWHDATHVLDRYNQQVSGPSSLEMNVRWLWSSTGPVLLLLLGGWWVRPNRKLLLVPLVFAATYFTLISANRVHFDRNLMPVLPALLAVAAIGATEVARRIATARHLSFDVVVVLVAVIVVSWPAVLAIQDSARATRDPRAAARAWIAANLPPRSRVVLEDYSPYVDPIRYRVDVVRVVLLVSPRPLRFGFDAVIVTARGSGLGSDERKAYTPTAAKRVHGMLRWLERNACDTASFDHGLNRIEIFRLRCNALGS